MQLWIFRDFSNLAYI